MITLSILLPLLTLGGIGGTYYVMDSKAKKEAADTKTKIEKLEKQVANLKTAKKENTEETIVNKETTQDKWRTTDKTALFTFEYPNGWYVFRDNREGKPDFILIDPDPISNAARGSFLSRIGIEDYAGSDTPENVLKDNISNSGKIITSPIKSKVTYNGIEFTRIKGKINTFGETKDYLVYHALVKQSGANTIHTHVIKARLNYTGLANEEEIFERIIKSIKTK